MTEHPDASRVENPREAPPDEGAIYDPSMTEGDAANIPPDSEADPNAIEEVQGTPAQQRRGVVGFLHQRRQRERAGGNDIGSETPQGHRETDPQDGTGAT
jgi:hypothetical protein